MREHTNSAAGSTTSAISAICQFRVNIMTTMPIIVKTAVKSCVMICWSEVDIVSISVVVRDNTSPCVCVS
ncbi:MAG: hypothetical protein DELT_03263 [Desulfovibrio sp.]